MIQKRKRLLFLLIFLPITGIVISIFLPYTYAVSRKIPIRSDREAVLSRIINLKTYALWYPWFISGTDVSATYSDEPFGEGSWMKWADSKSPAANRYSYKTTNIIRDSLVGFKLNLSDGFVLTGKYILSGLPVHRHLTTLTWIINIKGTRGGWFGALFSNKKKMIGDAMETGLINLKVLAEEAAKYNGMEIEELPLKETFVATISDTVESGRVLEFLPEILKDIKSGITRDDLHIIGNPIAQMQILSGNKTLLNAGFPVDHHGEPSGKIRILRMPPGYILCTEYHGEYKNVQKAYSALRQYARDHAKESPAPPWEEYLNGILPRSDTDNCSMEVCYPVY